MYKNAEEYATSHLAEVITVVFMPETEVPERLDRTRMIGAHALLVHLMNGDWSGNTNPNQFISEFIKRVNENAERQGVELADTALCMDDVPS